MFSQHTKKMFLDIKTALLMGVLMFGCMLAQEDRDNEVDPAKSFVKTLRNPDDPIDDGFMMDGQMTTESELAPKDRYCALNQTCSIFKYDMTGSWVSFKKSPCGNCTKGTGCTATRLDRRRCRIVFKCWPQPEWLLQLTRKERERIGKSFKLPAQNVLLQDENGQSVRELRHCPRYEFMSDFDVTGQSNATSERPIATVARIQAPLDDSTTEILEPSE